MPSASHEGCLECTLEDVMSSSACYRFPRFVPVPLSLLNYVHK